MQYIHLYTIYLRSLCTYEIFLVCDQSVDIDEEGITFGVCSQSEDG